MKINMKPLFKVGEEIQTTGMYVKNNKKGIPLFTVWEQTGVIKKIKNIYSKEIEITKTKTTEILNKLEYIYDVQAKGSRLSVSVSQKILDILVKGYRTFDGGYNSYSLTPQRIKIVIKNYIKQRILSEKNNISFQREQIKKYQMQLTEQHKLYDPIKLKLQQCNHLLNQVKNNQWVLKSNHNKISKEFYALSQTCYAKFLESEIAHIKYCTTPEKYIDNIKQIKRKIKLSEKAIKWNTQQIQLLLKMESPKYKTIKIATEPSYNYSI